MKSIQKFAKDNDLKIIEDCAHALGTKFDKKHVGTFGETGCFSFYPTKNLTTFEGGMIITQSKKMAENLRSLRNHGITKSLRQRFTKGHPWDFDIKQMGYNFRIDEIRSSLGLNQLKKIKKMNKLRRSACKYYNKNLKNIDGVSVYEDPNVQELIKEGTIRHFDTVKNAIDRDEINIKPGFPKWDSIEGEMLNQLNQVIRGNLSPRDALNIVQKRADDMGPFTF